MKLLSDTELIARVVTTKDTKAFEVLLRRHQALVKNWLRQLTSNYSHADDIAQETFIKAWDKLHTFRQESKFESWLISIAYTNFLQFKRKQKSQATLLEQVDKLGTQASSYIDDQSLPDLEKVLSILSFEEKACMVLSYSHGYSHQEICNITTLPLGTVKSTIKRSTEKIRHEFNIEV